MRNHTKLTYIVGQRVTCNGGFPGVIERVEDGVLLGMYCVRLARGTVCVGWDSIFPA